MTILSFSGVLRVLVLAVVPVVAMLGCAGTAVAECGSHVSFVGSDDKVHFPDAKSPLLPKAPCQGPNCSGAPKAPAPIFPAPMSPAPLVKAIGLTPEDRCGRQLVYRWLASAAGAPIHRSEPIFHPPRAS